jgi:hypothetical protein
VSRFRIKFMKFMLALLLIAGAVGGWFWHRFRPDAKGRVVPLFESIDMAALPRFVSGIRTGGKLTIYEGLPHSGWERAVFQSEVDSKSNFKSHGHRFYSAPLAPGADDAAALLRLATAPDSFNEWSGMKTCGSYHPDWLLRWTTNDGSSHELHLCFGCDEAKIYGPDNQLYCDVGSAAIESFKLLLEQYATQRPRRRKS